MPFFTFNQRNPNGKFVTNHDRGIARVVVIEAECSDMANVIASAELGLELSRDLGARWRPVECYEARSQPMYFDISFREFAEFYRSGIDEVEAYVHYASGESEHWFLNRPWFEP